MRYIRVLWRHEHPDEPVELLSEIDDARWEVRKVERYRDGSAGWASRDDAAQSTRIGLEPMPPLQEISRDPEFLASEITPDEFERAWAAVRPSITTAAVPR